MKGHPVSELLLFLVSRRHSHVTSHSHFVCPTVSKQKHIFSIRISFGPDATAQQLSRSQLNATHAASDQASLEKPMTWCRGQSEPPIHGPGSPRDLVEHLKATPGRIRFDVLEKLRNTTQHPLIIGTLSDLGRDPGTHHGGGRVLQKALAP